MNESDSLKISVIIPAYNIEAKIGGCLESVITQSYKNIEVVVIDDGSTDRTGEIIDGYAARDSRIKVCHKENGGVSSARNRGIEIATGDYIGFADGDDALEGDMLGFLIGSALKHGADIAHCGYYRVENGEKKAIRGTEAEYVQTREEALDCIISGRLYTGALYTKLFKAEVIKGLRVDESIKINEDVLLCFYAFSKADKTVFTDKPLYDYIIHGDSSCNTTQWERKMSDALKVSGIILKETEGTPTYESAVFRHTKNLLSKHKAGKSYGARRASRKELLSFLKANKGATGRISKNVGRNIFLIRYTPHLYRPIFGIYTKFRKPNWDV